MSIEFKDILFFGTPILTLLFTCLFLKGKGEDGLKRDQSITGGRSSVWQYPVPNSIHQKLLHLIQKSNLKADKYLDLGCGEGTLTLKIAKVVDAEEINGIDSFFEKMPNGINCIQLDINNSKLPFENNSFQLVTAIEVIEHLYNIDHFMNEVYRVLEPRGHFLVSTPNLASWINRILLILGFQPTYSNISKKFYVGMPKLRPVLSYAGHIKLMTLKALTDLLRISGFKVLTKSGANVKWPNKIVTVLDALLYRFPSLASNIQVLAKKP